MRASVGGGGGGGAANVSDRGNGKIRRTEAAGEGGKNWNPLGLGVGRRPGTRFGRSQGNVGGDGLLINRSDKNQPHPHPHLTGSQGRPTAEDAPKSGNNSSLPSDSGARVSKIATALPKSCCFRRCFVAGFPRLFLLNKKNRLQHTLPADLASQGVLGAPSFIRAVPRSKRIGLIRLSGPNVEEATVGTTNKDDMHGCKSNQEPQVRVLTRPAGQTERWTVESGSRQPTCQQMA